MTGSGFKRPKGVARRGVGEEPSQSKSEKGEGATSGRGNRNARGWAAWKEQHGDEVKEQARKAAAAADTVPLWKQRYQSQWRPRMEPSPNSRTKPRHPIEYGPAWVRFVPREGGIENVGMPFAEVWIGGKSDGTRRRAVVSNSMVECSSRPEWRNNVPDMVEYMIQTASSPEEAQRYLPEDRVGTKVVVVEEFHCVTGHDSRGYSTVEWHRCQGEHCVYCRSNNEDTARVHMGFGGHWLMRLDQWQELLPLLRDAVTKCMKCGEGVFTIDAFDCPACEAEYVNKDTVDEETGREELDAALRDFLIDNEVECPSCGETVYMEPVGGCDLVVGQGRHRKVLDGCGNEELSLDPLVDYEFLIQAVPVTRGHRRVANIVVHDYRPADTELPLDVPDSFYEQDSLLEMYGYMPLREQVRLFNLREEDVSFSLVEAEDHLRRVIEANSANKETEDR